MRCRTVEEGQLKLILSSVITTPVVKFGTIVHTIYLACPIISSTQRKFEVHSEISYADPHIHIDVLILCNNLWRSQTCDI